MHIRYYFGKCDCWLCTGETWEGGQGKTGHDTISQRVYSLPFNKTIIIKIISIHQNEERDRGGGKK